MKIVSAAQSREYWTNLARCAVRGLGGDALEEVVEKCLAADPATHPGVWHIASGVLGTRCPCAKCQSFPDIDNNIRA
jgi:hypothetical protein